MYRNRVFRLRNGEIWAVLCCKMVVLLMLRNCVFRMSFGWFGDSQKYLLQAAKRWDILIAILEEVRFADTQKFRFQAANISNTGISVLQEVRLDTSQIPCFRKWNVQICAVTFYKGTIYWLWGFAASVFNKFGYLQWWHETTSICWCLGIAFSGLVIFTYEYCCHAWRSILWCTEIAFWNCQKLWYGMCHAARGSICWCSEIEFSGCEKFEYGQQLCRLAISQKSCFRGAKRSNRSSTILQDVRFPDVQEFRFQREKRSNWAVLSNN